jgi:dolichol-phosphate mannosyltransferase
MPRVSVVIPTINESETIGELIEALQEHRKTYNLQIVVVDDGSTDGTIEAIQQLNRRHDNITLIERGRKLGFGTAIIDGIKTALTQDPKPDLIATMDADLSHDPRELPKLIQQCTRDTLVIGSRYTQGGEIHGWGPYRKTLSWGANLLARVFANVPAKDSTSGYRCYGTDLAQAILPRLESSGYDIQIEALAESARRGFEIKETPITFQDRTTGESKLKSGQLWEFVKRTYKLFRKSNEWKRIIKFSIVGISGLILNEAMLWYLTESFGLYYLYSGMISAEASVLNNFIWNDVWTFHDRTETSNQSLLSRFIKFHISRIAGLVIGFLIFAFLTEIVRMHYLIANVSSIMIIMIYDYLTSRGWVWS